MPAGKYNFTIEQGADFNRTFTYKPTDWEAALWTADSGAVATAKMHIREAKGASDTIITLESGSGIGVVPNNGAENVAISISIGASLTEAMNFRLGYYDLEIVNTLGNVYRILEGYVMLSREVTVGDEALTNQDVVGPFRLGIGEILSGYDYQSITLPVNITVTRIQVRASCVAESPASIQVRSSDATSHGNPGGVLFATVAVATGEYQGDWNSADSGKDEFVINRASSHKLVIYVAAGGVLTDVEVFFSIKR